MIFTRSNNQDKDDIIIIFLLYNITIYYIKDYQSGGCHPRTVGMKKLQKRRKHF